MVIDHLNIHMIDDDFIIKNFFTSIGDIKLCTCWHKRLTTEVKEYITHRFKEQSRSYKEALFRIRFGIEEIPKCPICGEPCYFMGKAQSKKHSLYKSHCNSNRCVHYIRKPKADKTRELHFGNKNFRNIEKAKKTNLERRGVEWTFQDPKVKEKIYDAWMTKYGGMGFASKIMADKIAWHNIETHGAPNPFQWEEVKEKIKDIKNKRYGDPYYLNREQYIDTCNRLYGGCGYGSPKLQKKAEDTCLELYGDIYWIRTQAAADYYDNIIHDINEYKRRHKKRYKGGDSDEEIKSYFLLKKWFPDAKRNHKDLKRYPFKCDIWIPSIDVWIECQYYPTHGSHPYMSIPDETAEINKIMNCKIIGGTPDEKLFTFIIGDPLKRQFAYENNLNYYEAFTMKEFKHILEHIKQKYLT